MQLTSTLNPIDEIIFIIEQNQSKCSTLKHTISVKYAYENELTKITNQFIYELIFDLRNVLTMLDQLKANNIQLNNKLHLTENELTESNAKFKTIQDKLYTLESALNEADRRNKQLTAINQSNQNYIEELLLKLKLNNNCCCKCGNFQQQQVLDGAEVEVHNKNRSMITTVSNVNESKQHSPLLNKTNRNYSYNNKQYTQLHFDYDSITNNNPIKTNYQIYRQQSLGNMMNIKNKAHYYSRKPLSSLSTTQYTSVFGKKNYNNNILTSLSNSKNETMKIEINSDSQRRLSEHKLTENIKQHSDNDNDKIKYQQQLYLNTTDIDLINNKINRVQQLVMNAFKNENTLNQLENKLGNDLEKKLTNAEVDEEYLNQIEQALNEINNGKISSQNISKRIQNQFENNPMNSKHYYKTNLKQEIVNKSNYSKEYPKKYRSLKDYSINTKPVSFNKTNFS